MTGLSTSISSGGGTPINIFYIVRFMVKIEYNKESFPQVMHLLKTLKVFALHLKHYKTLNWYFACG